MGGSLNVGKRSAIIVSVSYSNMLGFVLPQSDYHVYSSTGTVPTEILAWSEL